MSPSRIDDIQQKLGQGRPGGHTALLHRGVYARKLRIDSSQRQPCRCWRFASLLAFAKPCLPNSSASTHCAPRDSGPSRSFRARARYRCGLGPSNFTNDQYFLVQPGLENYTFLTCRLPMKRLNVLAGSQGQIWRGFSNAKEIQSFFEAETSKPDPHFSRPWDGAREPVFWRVAKCTPF
jgi:hypothetical protein